ncbi:MAG: hypothetical protein IJZ16_02730 [Clostridia bacterium]|nr:hypothetical protein [Clostridia bacterium]
MKKIISVIFVLLIIVLSMPISVMTANAETAICSECNSEYINGFCTCENIYEPAKINSDGYYEINNAGQLYWFGAEVNNGNVGINAILTDNIDLNPGYVFSEDGTVTYNGEIVTEGWLSWSSIGNSTNKYNAIFDGNGKTVSGLYFNGEITDHYGMFGVTGVNAEIKNLGLVNSYIYSTNSKNYFSAGIVGLNYNKVTSCYSSFTIKGAHYTGGVVGCNQTDGFVFDCYNTGAVNAETINYAKYAGGVVAYNYGTVEKCHNTGAVYAYSGYCAGVVGYNNYGKVRFCYNEGTATATNNGKNAGVVGCNYYGEVFQCFNTGNITHSAASCTAGVVGVNTGGTVSYCYNTGDIDGNTNTAGVAAYNEEASTIRICFNIGNITGKNTITGGIASTMYDASLISDCYNWGDVYSVYRTTGGISAGCSGYNENNGSLASQIINCYNIGNVSNGRNKSFGQIFNDSAYIKGEAINCYYLSETESKSEAQFNSGEVTALLNGTASASECIWKQEIGVDPYPVFSDNIVFYDGTNYDEIKTILSPMSSQIRFKRNTDGSYANKFDIRTRAMITDEDFKNYIAETNDEAIKKISKVGFVYSQSLNDFSTEDAKGVAQGEEISGYVDAPVSYIQDADGYYMFTCLVTGITEDYLDNGLTAYAYICVDDTWYFFPVEVTAEFGELYSTYYPIAAEQYGWEV